MDRWTVIVGSAACSFGHLFDCAGDPTAMAFYKVFVNGLGLCFLQRLSAIKIDHGQACGELVCGAPETVPRQHRDTGLLKQTFAENLSTIDAPGFQALSMVLEAREQIEATRGLTECRTGIRERQVGMKP